MKRFKNLNEALLNLSRVAIISHIKPDVDALASSIVLANILKDKYNIEADIFADELDISAQNSLIKGLKINKKAKKYEAVLMLDAPNSSRLGKYQAIFDNSNKKIVIDHHATNSYSGDINIVELVSSCCEIIYNFAKEVDYTFKLDDYIKIYAGIITDTNNFTVGNFNKNTFEIAGEISQFVDCHEIYEQFLATNTLKSMQVLAKSIKNIEIFDDGKIIFSKITKKEDLSMSLSSQDYEGIINKLATISKNIFVCFVYPKNNAYYVSMRAKSKYNVAAIAKANGGGGHIGAAAYLSNQPISKIKESVINEFKKQLKK